MVLLKHAYGVVEEHLKAVEQRRDDFLTLLVRLKMPIAGYQRLSRDATEWKAKGRSASKTPTASNISWHVSYLSSTRPSTL